jgi:DNA processing protein
VEAALKSGSLITARMAVEQGKDVFAVPGSIHSPQARGCHLLIRQGAKLVETAQDVLEELQLAPPRASDAAGDEPLATAGDDLLAALGFDPVGLDALIARTGIPAPLLQAKLLELELAGDVARLPGGLFQRSGAA